MIDRCIFCDIAAHRAPASIVYEDGDVVAVMDVAPINPGHLLVMPRHHAVGLADLDVTVGAHLWVVAQRLAGALRRSNVRCDGINLFLADGAAAFQEVVHVHLHVVPRFTGDSFKISADWSARPSRSELDAVAAQLHLANTM